MLHRCTDSREVEPAFGSSSTAVRPEGHRAYLEIPPLFRATPIMPPLANRCALVDDDGVFGWPDIPNNATVASERNDEDPVARNEVD